MGTQEKTHRQWPKKLTMSQASEEYPVRRPFYANPPVVETSLCVQFKPLKGFKSLHYGLFWLNHLSELGWRPVADEGLFGRLTEPFGSPQLKPDPSDDEVVGVRVRLENAAGDRSLQFQPDKIFLSWLRPEKGGGQRPQYSELKDEFTELFRVLTYFAEQSELEPIQPDLWEVKYLNQIQPGGLWNEPEEWHRALPTLFTPNVSPVEELRFATFDGEWFYEIKPEKGRVRVRVAKMLVNQKPPAVLYLRMLARGEIGSGGVPDWSSGLDVGHAACNRIFNAITSPEAQREWGIRHDV